MKKHLSTIILISILVIGLSLLLYPTVSDYWNSLHQTRAINNYVEQLTQIDNDTYEKIWNAAVEYNVRLAKQGTEWDLTKEQLADYNSQLDVLENGIMSIIEIPSIDCSLPIYHGTDEAVLQIAVGHLEATSLPVGGPGTHCALSGHRGLPSARLFTDLDKMVVGDIFTLRTMDTILTYEVDQIRIVLPDELEDLEIIEDKDLCTLVTCTPYGINTHRLLVRGHRIDNQEESLARVSADAMQIETTIIAPIVAVPIVIILIIWVLINTRSKKRRKR